MKKFIGTGSETPDEILDLLQANADSVEMMDYTRKFTNDQLLELKEKHTICSIELKDLQDRKKDVNSDFDSKIKPLKIDSVNLITKLKNKAESIKGDAYKFVDRESGMVGYYSPDGLLINARPMTEAERQFSLQGEIRNINQVNGK